jgi:hypothetical protein
MPPKLTPAEMSRNLRDMALRVAPSELDLAPTEERPNVFGILMDLGYGDAVATLSVFADGSASLYISTGGGVIGAGEHQTVRAASEQLLAIVEAHHADFERAKEVALPRGGRVHFHIRTFGGTLTAEADEQELGIGRHKLSPVFHAGHAVITQMRLASEGGGK